VIEISESIEVVKLNDFKECASLNEVIFSPGSRLKQIEGFRVCTSLYRIEIPSSVKVIGRGGFKGCTSLSEVIFSPGSQLEEIDGFGESTSLCRLEVPSFIRRATILYPLHRCLREGILSIFVLFPNGVTNFPIHISLFRFANDKRQLYQFLSFSISLLNIAENNVSQWIRLRVSRMNS
jgi:hypothetical protein